ncbi:hypothetical protein BUALT_Bualt19G0119700 [Buddleja alternifolia]|uniref:RBR-type E3 ubiquitin transferase n=1 Tax=Buddleja alternifolia TaxID=168488 RepID=A0AAV6WBL6_9LAMI|nr:hypothetical protein BUALT_Bualt19G0119700 [Buddleja alternifolia]
MGNTLQTLPPTPPPPHPHEQDQQIQNDDGSNQEFTCEICIEPTLSPTKKFKNANKCSHAFCTDCMVKYIRVKLEENDVGAIACPAFSCGHALDPVACASLVGDALFVRWCDALCESAILGFDKCYCPYRNCNALIVNECGGIVRKSSCPNCKRCFCFQCKRAWHAGFGCSESGELRDVNDVAFGRLAEQRKWMRCPRCRHFVELMEGCQIVKCRRIPRLDSASAWGVDLECVSIQLHLSFSKAPFYVGSVSATSVESKFTSIGVVATKHLRAANGASESVFFSSSSHLRSFS